MLTWRDLEVAEMYLGHHVDIFMSYSATPSAWKASDNLRLRCISTEIISRPEGAKKAGKFWRGWQLKPVGRHNFTTPANTHAWIADVLFRWRRLDYDAAAAAAATELPTSDRYRQKWKIIRRKQETDGILRTPMSVILVAGNTEFNVLCQTSK